MAEIQTDHLNELDFHDSTVAVHYGLSEKDLMADIQTDHLNELDLQNSTVAVHYGLLEKNKETIISSKVLLLPENITSLDLTHFKIFKAVHVATGDDGSEQQ